MGGSLKILGVVWTPSTTLSIIILLKVMRKVEGYIVEAISLDKRNLLTSYFTNTTIRKAISVGGNEGLLLDLDGLHKH